MFCLSAWNPNVPCFDWKRPCFGGKTKDKWVPGVCRVVEAAVFFPPCFLQDGHLGPNLEEPFLVFFSVEEATWFLKRK